jgi:hypothetical protein
VFAESLWLNKAERATVSLSHDVLFSPIVIPSLGNIVHNQLLHGVFFFSCVSGTGGR